MLIATVMYNIVSYLLVHSLRTAWIHDDCIRIDVVSLLWVSWALSLDVLLLIPHLYHINCIVCKHSAFHWSDHILGTYTPTHTQTQLAWSSSWDACSQASKTVEIKAPFKCTFNKIYYVNCMAVIVNSACDRCCKCNRG